MEGEKDFRSRFINEALELCESHKHLMTDWENNFIIDIARVHRKSWKELTQKQYNQLQIITANVKRQINEVCRNEYQYPVYER